MDELYNEPGCETEKECVRITIDANGIREETYEPLTMEDIDDLDCMYLDELNLEDLEDLLSKAEDLLDEVDELEPEDEDSEDHDLWEARFSEVENFIDRINSRIGDLEDEEEE